MDFLEIAQKRYSCRKYSDKKIDRETLLELVKVARLAPSACNSQPWHFVLIDDADKIEQVAKATQKGGLGFINKFTPTAKAFLVLVKEKPGFSEKMAKVMTSRDYTPYDIGIVTATITYRATELGLGSCILGWFDEDKIKEILSVPKKHFVDLVIALGYPETADVPEKRRKDESEVLSFNSYGAKNEDK